MNNSSNEETAPQRTNALKPLNKAICDAELASCIVKYKVLRRRARRLLEEEVLRAFRIKLEVTGISGDEFRAVREDWTPKGRRVEFPWEEEIMPTLCKSHPRRLDLAFWSGKELCGLAAARLSDSKQWLSITFLENSPNPSHALKGVTAPISLVGADIYASLVQEASTHKIAKPVIRLLNPLKEAMGAYERIGYSVVTQANGYTFATFRGE